jgi:nucleoside-diphosphate-sugar epimerase
MTAMHLGFGDRRIEPTRPVILFGANGNLGRPIWRQLTASGRRVQAFSWNDVAGWLDPSNSVVQAQRIVAEISQIARHNIDFLFAGGLTDPSRPAEHLFLSNTYFPKSIIAAAESLAGCRYVTFGSIMERFGGNVADNPYAASKIELGKWLTEQIETNGEGMGLRGRIVHLQLHTLYGGVEPSPHMFLGQMIDALRRCRPFLMSAGRQLREYHHVEDVAGSVVRLLSVSPWPCDPILTLSSGRPVRLAELARTIFEDCGRMSDLQIGVLATGESENFERIFPVAPAWLLEPSREPLSGVFAWVSGLSGCESRGKAGH